MRALLVVNPSATTTSERSRAVLSAALAGTLDLRTVVTSYRGHARDLARDAVADAVDVVVALGGDGTVNEVVNGLLTDGPDEKLPALAVVPGGSTNVFARGLGLPNDPVEATGALLDALTAGVSRRVGLGKVLSPDLPPRWFTFCAGLGFDAGVVDRVERHRAAGKRSTHTLYLGQVAGQFLEQRRQRRARERAGNPAPGPVLTLEVPGRPPVEGLRLAIVSNTSPWTYLGPLPLQPSPDASFDDGLDLFGLTRMSLLTTGRTARQMLTPQGGGPRGKDVVALHDADEFTLTADAPLPFQVDGDHLGERSSATFVGVRSALRVLVPPA